MPIIGWQCPECKRQVPLDHYETSTCGLVIHPSFAQAVLHSNDDRYVQEREVTVTIALGCPRSRAIEHAEDVFVNPLDYNALIIGDAWDRQMEKFGPKEPGWAKVHVRGEIAGIEVQGEIDLIRRCGDKLILEDFKHSNNFRYKYIKAEEVGAEYRIQTSIYAELYRQQFGVQLDAGIVWYHFSGANKSSAPPLVPKAYAFMPLAECLAYKPHGGQYTVLELYHQAESFRAGLPALELPLVGETMAFGKADFCDYCEVSAACKTAAYGANF